MKSHKIGRFTVEYAPSKDLPVTLYDETGVMIDWWDDLYEARMDIDYSPVGEEITLEQWQSLWGWIEQVSENQSAKVDKAT